MALYTYEVDQLSKSAWHKVLLSFTDASIDQTSSYAEARWHKASISHLVVKRDGNIVAATQVNIRRVPFLRSGVAHIKFGPLWKPTDQPTNPEHLQQILHFLREEYVIKRGLLLRLMPAPEKCSTNVAFTNALQRASYTKNTITASERYILNLSATVEEIRKNLKGRWRNHLNRAEKHNLVCQWLEGKEALDMFMALYGNMINRKAFIDTSAIAELSAFYNDLEPALKPKILICFAQNVPIAGAVISAMGDTAQYLFGATNTKGLELDAGYYVQWEVVKWLHNQGIAWYDLGGGVGNDGLRQFKSGLIGKNGVEGTLLGEFDCCEHIFSRIVATLAFKLRKINSFIRYYSWQTSL
jgi:lipid II:glycine glycyltransferase (peptidoglycan interpeptide bridge formation enzyme)